MKHKHRTFYINQAITRNHTMQSDSIFFSLHQPVTKKPNTKHQISAISFVIVSMQKETEKERKESTLLIITVTL